MERSGACGADRHTRGQRKDEDIGYKNGADILPEALLRELQRYAEGEIIYIPRRDKRSKWGENSGTREEYKERNRMIARERRDGATVAELAHRYCLSEDSIRKILRGDK